MGADTLTAPSEQASAAPHRTITILSPKGGSGKTSVATNLAVGLANRNPRQVVLVDLDLQFGDVANVLRLAPTTTIGDVAKKWPIDSANLKLGLTTHPSGLFTLCAPLDPADADDILSDHATGIISALHRSFKYVVIDTDPGLSERVLSALDVSTDLVLICATEIPSIRGLQKALHALDVVGLTAANRYFLLNRADAKVGIELADIERSIGHKVDVSLPSSIDMVRATNDGIPIMESRTNPTLVRAFEDLVDLIDPPADKFAGGDGGSRRLFKRKA